MGKKGNKVVKKGNKVVLYDEEVPESYLEPYQELVEPVKAMAGEEAGELFNTAVSYLYRLEATRIQSGSRSQRKMATYEIFLLSCQVDKERYNHMLQDERYKIAIDAIQLMFQEYNTTLVNIGDLDKSVIQNLYYNSKGSEMNKINRKTLRTASLTLFAKDFPSFCEHCIKIKDKKGSIIPYNFNEAQRRLYAMVRNQREDRGLTRIIVLKARQMGISTFFTAFNLWEQLFAEHRSVNIITHIKTSSDHIFDTLKTMIYNLPTELKPDLEKDNTDEVLFGDGTCRFTIATAGSREVGRGSTLQAIHASEVAFWEKADATVKGLGQAVPQDFGTVVIESTANGINNGFHDMWNSAQRKDALFKPIFLPWFIMPDYIATPPSDFEITDSEAELKELYKLTDEQLYWRRLKISTMVGDERQRELAFNQEYPNCAAEAFVHSGSEGLIPSACVTRARQRNLKMVREHYYVVGVDPARENDRFSVIKRMGRVAWDVASHSFQDYTLDDGVAVVETILNTIDPRAGKKPDVVFIDYSYGADIRDVLHSRGYTNVYCVNFGSSAYDKDRYLNKRAEMWATLHKWLTEEEVDLPDSDSLHADLVASPYQYCGRGKMQMVDKKKIKSAFGFSPDEGDALALTFANPRFNGLANVQQLGYSNSIQITY